MTTKFSSVEEYFASQPTEVQAMLQEMRNTIRQAAPKAQEVISYNMPAFKMHSVLVYYAAAKEHLGFYPTAAPISVFADELAKYKTSKGAVRFPLDKPVPKGLIKKIVKYRLGEDEARAKAKKKR